MGIERGIFVTTGVCVRVLGLMSIIVIEARPVRARGPLRLGVAFLRAKQCNVWDWCARVSCIWRSPFLVDGPHALHGIRGAISPFFWERRGCMSWRYGREREGIAL